MAQPRLISFKYCLKNSDGQEIESSSEEIGFVEGQGQLFPKLEEAICTRKIGDQFDVPIGPADGFGEYNEELILEVPAEEISGQAELNDIVVAQNESGEEVEFRVVEKREESFILDGNHPLAGLDLIFSIEIISSKEATDEEINSTEHQH